MGNIRSEEKRRVRFNRKHANDLFLKFSLHDKVLAETVHTVDTEKIKAEKLVERFPYTLKFFSNLSNGFLAPVRFI